MKGGEEKGRIKKKRGQDKTRHQKGNKGKSKEKKRKEEV